MVNRKLKKTLSISLVVILLLPMTIKLFDGLFHHHDHFHCWAINEKHFHKYHEKCPIPTFELSFFSDQNHSPATQNLIHRVVYIDNYNSEYCGKKFDYSFLLRAPPGQAKRSITSKWL